jgi:hypothetical protein
VPSPFVWWASWCSLVESSMKVLFVGALTPSTATSCGACLWMGVVGCGVGRGWCSCGVGLTHCWALRHQVQMFPVGGVMAGWFLGVCHVDSGREHQPAPILLGVLRTVVWFLGFAWGSWGVGCLFFVVLCFLYAIAHVHRLIAQLVGCGGCVVC